jgi:hypothetical protein
MTPRHDHAGNPTDPEPEAERAALRHILQEVCSACASAEATLWVPTNEGRTLRAFLNVGPTTATVEGLEVPVHASLVGWVWASGLGLTAGPEAAYNPTVDRTTGTPTHAMAAVPLRGPHGQVGVLSTINPVGRDLFGSADLKRLRAHATKLILMLKRI